MESGAVTNITTTSAKIEGKIIDLGMGMNEYGHCWSLNPNPSVADSITSFSNLTSTGPYFSNLQNLQPGTKYYTKAYAKDAGGTVYGYEVTFTTGSIVLATLTANNVTSITLTSAISGGNITSNGGGSITARGVCWSTTQNPTINDNKTTDGAGSGSFTSNLTGLYPGTIYYVRAYAINEVGTTYSSQVTFLTYMSDIEGNIYKTTSVGSQIWMAENLKTGKYKNNSSIPNISGNSEWANLTSAAYCWYNNDAATFKNIYGALYNWYAVTSGDLCPAGWHVPTDAEWSALADYLGGPAFAGGKLKENGTAHWINPNSGATNESGFTALPGGLRYNDGIFNWVNYGGYWWSSTETNSYSSLNINLAYDFINVGRSSNDKKDGFSVRCIKN